MATDGETEELSNPTAVEDKAPSHSPAATVALGSTPQPSSGDTKSKHQRVTATGVPCQALILQSKGQALQSTSRGVWKHLQGFPSRGVRKHLQGFPADASLVEAEEPKGIGYRRCHSLKEPASYTIKEINLKQNKTKNLALCKK